MTLTNAFPSRTPFAARLAPEFFDRVQARLLPSLEAESLDAVLTDDPEDVAYLTGFFHHPCERPVAVWLAADGQSILMTPTLERENAERQQARADQLVSYAEFPGVEAPFTSLARAVVGAPRRVGFSTHMTHERLTAAMLALPGCEFVPTTLITVARYVKFDEEIALHREAARITDVMLEAGVEHLTEAISRRGTLPSEAELAAHVTSTGVKTMYREHDDVVVVSPLAGGLVYAGANSAFPHGLPSGYRLQPGDTFMLSLGCAVGGRFVEGERTFVLGEPTDDQRRYHDTVRLAQKIGGEAIRPGAECRAANTTCLAVIEDAGLGRYLRHRQGHGIGLGMHEPPWLEAGDATLLEPGMVVSNEPGIYIPGHAGYRISDSMLVTEHGSEPLTSFGRDLEHCTIAL
ncbi:Xaa-Pro peptidase family protein [Subtercola sp. RTI3]|uniref:M24 family metallopeptidase n=1 Tax=Subtercola sp. RTI3 TaxID=3048639 RepID=UPI002B22F26B|nr:Xaa-Pro peptidase family protein [Subtercola sp. RTI3]MEA9985498.1 Xaa-Pro peptidase family protein [Subtercola sp. RTI3]